MPIPAGLFFLGIWACALSWGAPCQFSGSTSLGRDVGSALNPRATQQQLIRYTKWSLLLLTGLMVLFGTLRTEQSAWWNILAWTARNSATFAPVLGALFWPIVSKRGVIISMASGFLSGILWYHLGDWSPNAFYLNIHPVWVGMGVNLGMMMIVTVWEQRGRLTLSIPRTSAFWLSVFLSLCLGLMSVASFDTLYASGLLGLALFTLLITFFLMLIQLTNTSSSISEKGQMKERSTSFI